MASLPESGIQLVAQGASAYIADVDRAAKATGDFASAGENAAGRTSAFGQVITGALRKVGEVAVEALGMAARAAGQFLADSVTSAADVEQTLAVMGATSGASAEQLERVRDTAISLGGDLSLPATSAQDAADAMLELTKAGFTVDEAMAAAKGTLQLAAAAQVDAGEAAAITAQAINAFGLEASDAAHIADLLAGGANASSASMTDLAQGLQQGGFAFDASGQSVDDLVTSVAALTNVGLTGSDAGTALKNAMMRLMNPTDKAAKLMAQLGIDAYDAQGNMKPWPELLEHIRGATAGMTEEERNAALGTIFLSDGMKAMIPLLDMSAEEYATLAGQVGKVGSAQDVAGAQTQGFNGAVAGLQSQMETLQLIIGTKLLPLLTPLIQQVSAGVSAFTTFASAMMESGDPIAFLSEQFPIVQQVIDGFNAAVAAAQPYLDQLANAINTQVIPAAMEVWRVFNAQVVPILMNLVTAVLPLIPAMLQIVASYWTNILVPALSAAWAFFKDNILPILAQVAAFLAENLPPVIQLVADFISNTLLPALKDAGAFITDTVIPVLTDLAEKALTAVLDAAKNVSEFWTDTLQPALKTVADFISTTAKEAFEGIQPVLKTMGEIAGTVAGAFDGIAKAIAGAVSKVKEFIEWAAKIKVPSLVTPGSPTPLEIGMRGIADATDIAAQALAGKFNVALANMPTAQVSAAIAKPSSGGGSSTTNNSRVLNFSPSYGGSVRPSPALDISLARSLAS